LTQAQLEVYELEDMQFRRMFAELINEERAEGYAEGCAEAKREIAVRLLKENFSFDLIARVTGLSTAEVQSLKK
jgi:predicted transposase/invertase (TIGR01784 family)